MRFILGLESNDCRKSTLQLALKQARRLGGVTPGEPSSHTQFILRRSKNDQDKDEMVDTFFDAYSEEEMDVLTSLSLYLIVLDQLGHIFGKHNSKSNRVRDALDISLITAGMSNTELDAIKELRNSINHNFGLSSCKVGSDKGKFKFIICFDDNGYNKPVVEPHFEWSGDWFDKSEDTSFHVYPFSLMNYVEKVIEAFSSLIQKGEITSTLPIEELETRFTIKTCSDGDGAQEYSTEVSEEDLANAWTDEYGVKYSADRTKLLDASIIETDSYSIIEGTRIICDSAFELCKLNSIQIPDGVIKIGDSSFAACELSSVCLPSSIIEIKHYAFGKSTVSTIILNDGLKIIGESAFELTNLNSITIPKSVKEIGDYVFENCRKLTSIVVDDINEHFDSRNNCNAIIRKSDNVLIAGCKTTTIPQGVKKIGCGAFAFCNGLISITIPNGVVGIGENAFFDCQNLSSVVIPDSVTHICDQAFARCTNLSEIVIPNSVEWIGKAAFARCEKLSKIVIPDSVVYLCNSAFEYCISLNFVKLSNRLPIIGNYTFADCSSLNTITIPNGVTDIEDAFCNCKCLSSISIPNSVTCFGYNTFLNCYSLSKIIIPVGRRDKFEKLLPYYKDKLVEQFEEENLSTEITDEDLKNAWTDEYGVMYSADRKRLLKAPGNITKYSIPIGTKVICNGYTSNYDWGRRKIGAFNGCTVLTRVDIPNTVTHIGYKAFYNCSNLTTLVFPDSIVSLGEQVFDGCFQLQKIIIPFGTKERYHFWLPQFSHKFLEQINGWSVKETRLFNAEEIAAVAKAEVVPSQYGKSVCFFMNSEKQTYIPLSEHSEMAVGDEIDLKTAKLITLSRKGNADIYRVIE